MDFITLGFLLWDLFGWFFCGITNPQGNTNLLACFCGIYGNFWRLPRSPRQNGNFRESIEIKDNCLGQTLEILRGIAFWIYSTSLFPHLKDETLNLGTMISTLRQ